MISISAGSTPLYSDGGSYIVLGLLTLLGVSWCVWRGFKRRDTRIDDMEAELSLKEKHGKTLERFLEEKGL